MSSITDSLQQVFGFSHFRTGQQQCIEQLLAEQSSLAIFPTGSGKSLCYQFTALHLPHLTLVVSPLLALIKDQLAFLHSKGIAAASIDSSLTTDQNKQVMTDVAQGNVKILMVSVERFKNERFRRFIESVAISMLVIDEAHCISEWGHNFRPDYLKLPQYRQELNIPLVLLLTATATANVKKDMAQRFNIVESNIVQTGFYRQNLNLAVLPTIEADKRQMLLTTIQQQASDDIGIVYVTLQQSAEQVASYLQQQGITAVAYHAGLVDEKRQAIQQLFMQGKYQVVVATIAFGMGIDKSNIRFVIHYDLAKSIENYSQEIGRAGRDGLPANCVSLANLDSVNTLENFVYGDTPEHSGIAMVLDEIKQNSQGQQWEMQINAISNTSNIRQLPLKTLLVQLEMQSVIKPLYSYFAEFKYKFVLPKDDLLATFSGERQVFLSAIFSTSQMKRVWGQVDFAQLQDSYDCERSRVVTALEYLAQKGMIELQTKGITEVFSVNDQALNNNELTQQLYDYFIDKEHKEIARIAQLIAFFQKDTCLNGYLTEYFDDNQAIEHCGHCSVCEGKIAILPLSQPQTLPDDEMIKSWLQGLKSHLANKSLTSEIYCRFLTGISMPLFARNKVRNLAGFGALSLMRYAEIRQLVTRLL